MRRLVTVVCCDLCAREDSYEVGSGLSQAEGWVRDEWPSGDVVDLCPGCAAVTLTSGEFKAGR